MSRTLWKKLQMGLISLSVVGLLAACGMGDVNDTPVDDDPSVEEPVDGDEDMGTDETDVDENEEDDAS